jgi:RNA polymerase sigma-70 factor (ECF subfamily)
MAPPSPPEERYERGRAAWPTVKLPRETFLAHLARLPESQGDHEDLYLAAGCAAGEPRALAAFDASCLAGVGQFVRRIDSSPDFADEVKQLLRERLLVARASAPPRIAEYTGRGPLAGWVRVAATRMALDLKEHLGRLPLESEPAETAFPASALTPEAALLKEKYRGTYERLLREALRELEARDRDILRMHFVEGLSAEDIAQRHRVHRATSSRWLARIRSELMARVQEQLQQTLKLKGAELNSLTGLVRSQLGVSLSALMS